ncbi:hypothetical protein PanWU01x14_137750 [Parasponia andersonii]|uniref:Uncharacterized protein n=1 Tax=Parasponia andersonii TaxID=3476 RepID=A0A2P5CN36_PARAD|nr:hypothetical protein PanWU01x14_137750 [Parasponia andersonii]
MLVFLLDRRPFRLQLSLSALVAIRAPQQRFRAEYPC